MILHSSNLLAALAVSLTVSSCAELVEIKSSPPGGKAFIDDKFVGTTPTNAEIPRSEVSGNHTWRIEYRNCEPAEGRLQTGIAGGRVFSYIITVGIVAIFRGPYYFLPVDVPLGGGDCEGPLRTTGRAAPPGITVQQIVGDHNLAGPGSQQSQTQRLAERLMTLRDLYNRKLISEKVYEQETQKAVKELGD